MTTFYTTSAWLPMSNGLSTAYGCNYVTDRDVTHKKKARDDVNWSSKYLTSDHHDDRLTHNLAQYHTATGRQHPDFTFEALKTSYNHHINGLHVDTDFDNQFVPLEMTHVTRLSSLSSKPPLPGKASGQLSPPARPGLQSSYSHRQPLPSPAPRTSLPLSTPSATLTLARRPSITNVRGSLSSREASPSRLAGSTSPSRSRTPVFYQGQGQGQSLPFQRRSSLAHNAYSSMYSPVARTASMPDKMLPFSHTYSFNEREKSDTLPTMNRQPNGWNRSPSPRSSFSRTTSMLSDSSVNGGEAYQIAKHVPLSDARRKLRDALRKSRYDNATL